MKRKVFIGILSVVILSAIVLVGAVLIKHEINQDTQIKSLQAELSFMRSQSNAVSKVWYAEDTFNYLAIGNSITWHGKCDYWWSQRGMAASTTDKDYYHIVLKHIQDTKGKTTSYVTNFNIWENMSSDRAETLVSLDPYLDAKIDLVTIQLGENIKSLDTFQSDFEYLITYIKSAAPEAQIIVIGDFWVFPTRDSIKQEVAEKMGCQFVSLAEIKGKKNYLREMNSVIYDDEGVEHIVEHSGVTKHPNDEAMAYIAEKVIEVIY